MSLCVRERPLILNNLSVSQNLKSGHSIRFTKHTSLLVQSWNGLMPWPRFHTVKLHSSTHHWQWSTCDRWGPLEPSTSLESCHHEKHSSPCSGDLSTYQSLQSVECQDYKCLPINTSLSIRPSLIVGRMHGYPCPIMQNWEVIFLS